MHAKHVVKGARDCQTILVTAFGPFPGAPHNPTVAIVERLDGMRAHLGRHGIRLATGVLSVVYDQIDDALRRAVGERPDSILHLGVASRRKMISVETRAVNRVNYLRPDAAGNCPSPLLSDTGPETLSTTYDAGGIAAAIRSLGQPVRLSRSAGDYVCNALLYRSLQAQAAPQIGFIHVPMPGGLGGGTLSTEDLTAAVETAICVMARRSPTAARWSEPMEPTTDAAPGDP